MMAGTVFSDTVYITDQRINQAAPTHGLKFSKKGCAALKYVCVHKLFCASTTHASR